MKKEVIIHIGSGKTGTTSIQHMLGQSEQHLLDAGIMYHPTHPKQPNHHNLVSTPFDTSMWERDRPVHTQLKQKFESSPASKMIISTERIFGAPKYYLEELKKLYWNMDIKIIVYIRNQVDMIPSQFLQRQKDIETEYLFSIENAFKKYKDIWGMHPNKLMTRWMPVFKKENMIVRIYDRELLDDGDVCRDFAKALGITDHVDLEMQLNENASLIPELSKLTSVIDREFPNLSKNNFPFRQMNIIKPLLNISLNYKKSKEYDNFFNILKDNLKVYCKKQLNCNDLPEPVENEITRSRELLKKKIKINLVNEELRTEILNYYKEMNYKFSDIFLNEKEKKSFLKHYRKS